MILGLALALTCLTAASASVMQLSETGTGQVLLFPYYTARNGNVSLVSLVNTTVQAKAVRVTVREARGGFVVAQFNLYLSAKDVWTGAVVGDDDGAKLVTNDRSCSSPNFAYVPNPFAPPAAIPSLPFSADGYRGDNAGVVTRDRTREGYMEVIEMATIPNGKPLGVAVTHVAGVAPCTRRRVDETDANYVAPDNDLLPPSGGLMGTLSFVNVGKGMLASAAPTVIENFWLTGPNAPAPRVVPANSAAIDLTSGKNSSVAFAGSRSVAAANSATTYSVERYTARFATSIDAVSALLMSSSVYSEYAFTQDNVISTLLMLTMPTKPYYIHSDPLAPALGPFSSAWDKVLAKACDNIGVAAYTREEETPSTPDDFGTPPPRPASLVCSVANPLVSLTNLFYYVYGLPAADDPTFLGASNTLGFMAIQNGGAAVPRPGKEGGWVEFAWTSALSRLKALEASVYRRDISGKLVWQPVTATLIGLPIIGLTLSQAAYQTGSPQQNYADAVPLRSQTIVTTVP